MNEQAFTRRLASPARESIISRASRDALARDLWSRRAELTAERLPGVPLGRRTMQDRNVIIRRESYRWAASNPEVLRYDFEEKE